METFLECLSAVSLELLWSSLNSESFKSPTLFFILKSLICNWKTLQLGCFKRFSFWLFWTLSNLNFVFFILNVLKFKNFRIQIEHIVWITKQRCKNCCKLCVKTILQSVFCKNNFPILIFQNRFYQFSLKYLEMVFVELIWKICFCRNADFFLTLKFTKGNRDSYKIRICCTVTKAHILKRRNILRLYPSILLIRKLITYYSNRFILIKSFRLIIPVEKSQCPCWHQKWCRKRYRKLYQVLIL